MWTIEPKHILERSGVQNENSKAYPELACENAQMVQTVSRSVVWIIILLFQALPSALPMGKGVDNEWMPGPYSVFQPTSPSGLGEVGWESNRQPCPLNPADARLKRAEITADR